MSDNQYFREFQSDGEAETWARKYYSNVISLDPESEVGEALHGYTGSWYKVINPLMRILPPIYSNQYSKIDYNGYDEEIAATHTLNALLSEYSVPENIIVYRYTQTKNLRKLLQKRIIRKGQIFTDKAFVSTTLRKELLQGFAKENRCNCLLMIKVPKGCPGAYVSMEKIDTVLNEQEFLLPPCTKFRIDKIHWFTYPMLIECLAIPYAKGQEGGSYAVL